MLYPPIQLPPWALPIAKGEAPQLLLVAGGRASGKTGGIARAVTSLLSTRPNLRGAIVRDYRTGAQDGALRLCRDIVAEHGIEANAPRTSTRINYANGSELFVFGSALHSENVKELEGIDFLWAEEAQTLRPYAWELLESTIREPGCFIVLSFNPTRATDVVWRLWKEPPPYAKRVWTHPVSYTHLTLPTTPYV